ncbi:class I SAM-dependent methyltransferase [Candidatus Berkelbacteria bacterium]|nr:class I SAM-dependent methyltransferase [Candidatus Berkelbacteria bacterium]
MSELKELSFSVYTRYKSIQDCILALSKNKKIKILEVGGRGNFLKKFMPSYDITILDVIDSDEPNYIKGDGRSLPFKDNEFDIIVSTDVLEHIPAPDRKIFIEEQIRVAKIGLIIAFPSYNKEVVQIEKETNKLYRSLSGQEHPWLIEHLSFSLPQEKFVEKILETHRLTWSCYGNQDVRLWRQLLAIDILVAGVGAPEILKKFNELSAYYNSHVQQYDYHKNGYRKLYVANKNRGRLLLNKPSLQSISSQNIIELGMLMSIFMKEAFDQINKQTVKLRERLIDQWELEKEIHKSLEEIDRLNKKLHGIESSKLYKILAKIRGILNRFRK